MRAITSVSNSRWGNVQQTVLECDVLFEGNTDSWGYTALNNTGDAMVQAVWDAAIAAGNIADYAAPIVPPQTWAQFQQGAKYALADADNTLMRVQEAISLGLNTATAADVVAYVNYRRALRSIISAQNGTPGTLPAKPAYPAGT